MLLHGRGSDEHDLMGLAPGLPPHAILVAPREPFPGAPWGYGSGWAWYRFLGRNRPEPTSFATSQEAIGEFLTELPGQLPVQPGPLVLGGFSQGGTMSLGYALSNPGAVPRVLNFSGFLADHPSVRATPETVRGTRFFWGHGIHDPSIPYSLAIEGRALLNAAGADLATWDGPIGHGIAPEELTAATQWMGTGTSQQTDT